MSEETDKKIVITIWNYGQKIRLRCDGLFEAQEYSEELKEDCLNRDGEWCNFYDSECLDTLCDFIYIDEQEYWDEVL